MSRRCHSFFTCLFLALLLVGCATGRAGGFLSSYSEMKSQHSLDKVYVDPEVKFGQYPTLVLEVVNQAGDTGTFNEAQALFQVDSFRRQLKERIQQTGVFQNVITTDRSEDSPMRFRVSVTALNPGSQLMRILVGFGAGAARFEAEGEAVDSSTGASLLRFVDARSGDSLNEFEGNEKLLRDDIRAMAQNIADVFASHR